jgi:hypothetical protein
MRDPAYQAPAKPGEELRPPRPEEPPDLTRDTKAFTGAVRNRLFAFLRAWSIGQDEAALAVLDAPEDEQGEPWTAARLRAAREAHRAEHGQLRLDPEARNLRHTSVDAETDPGSWRVQQMLVDTEGVNDWVMDVAIGLAASRQAGQPVMRLARLGPLA